MSEDTIMSMNDQKIKIEPPEYSEEDIKCEIEDQFDILDDIVKSESCPEDHETCLERFMNSEVTIEEEVKQEPIETCDNTGLFAEPDQLKEHMVSHMPSQSKERPFECEICHKTFKLTKQLKAHMIAHSEERPFKCDVCHKTYKQLGHLKNHMLLHEGLSLHECNICNKPFTQLSKLKRHMLIHSGVRPHECNICNKKHSWN
ncbi:zinc finger protein 710-like [Ctenocephalides felis]|uniref:zinc finger protein 710-like n=1 Tax=Ctenocephalides felis TaxID=7515 RepID=UPI000E6E2C2F|nr:zinc finger protein 710-like [Ctenocephalides felis]